MTLWLPLLAAYLLGSLPFSYWIVKALTGEDIRNHDSGNVGSTNARRVLLKFAQTPQAKTRAKWITKIIFLLDVLKGTAAIVLFQRIGVEQQWIFLGGLAAIAGHMFSPFVGFKGGKGVATSFGMLVGLIPWVCLATFILWMVVYFTSGYVSLGSIVCALALPIFYFLMEKENFLNEPLLSGVLICLSLFIVFKHRANIKRILNGTEPKSNQADS